MRVLKNMAGVKLTRQSLFQASAGGHAMASHKADVVPLPARKGVLLPPEAAAVITL